MYFTTKSRFACIFAGSNTPAVAPGIRRHRQISDDLDFSDDPIRLERRYGFDLIRRGFSGLSMVKLHPSSSADEAFETSGFLAM